MDSIRQSHFQSVRPRADARDIGKRRQEEDAEGRERREDGFCESLLPEEELDREEEQREGERHEDELLEKYSLWENQAALAQLEEIFLTLEPFMLRSELPYEFLPLDAPVPFASSCPNGAVYFTRALLESLAHPDILFLAAHELAHTELRHYASRKRRLSELRQLIPAPIGSPTRTRMDMAAVLVVRHQEEFEADFRAGEWVGSSLGVDALTRLHHLCREISPESLRRPTHPPFEKRVRSLQQKLPFPPALEYLYSLIS